jgi:hypothetical protein
MKKYFFLAITGLVLMTGCAKQPTESSEAPLNSQTTEQTKEQATTVFTGVIRNEEQVTDANGNALVFLENIKAVTDPEQLVPGLATEGVGIQVSSKQAGDWAQWTKGATVQVTLADVPVMTRSLPPQIPGQSIKAVELVK